MSRGEREDYQFVIQQKKASTMNQKMQVPLNFSSFSLTDITIKNAHNRVTVRPVTRDNLGRRFDCLSAYAISSQSAFFVSPCSISTVSTLIDNATSLY